MALRIVAYRSELPNIIEDSTDRRVEFTTLLQALDFLNEPHELPNERECFKVTWDIDELVAPVFRFLTKAQALTLISTNELQLVWPLKEGKLVYKVKYVPGKFLILECKGEEWHSVFYHLQQYCPDDYIPKNVLEVKAFAHTVVDACRAMGFAPYNLFSPASIIGVYAKKLDLPKPEDIPEEASVYALRCVDRDWREAHRLGFFPHAAQYDLRGCFPNIHAKLLDYREGKWIHKQGYDPEAYYGYCRCRITIYPKVKVSPIIWRNPNAAQDGITLFSPTGSWTDYITLDEIKFIMRWKIGTVTVIDGWYFYPNVFIHRPIATFIERILKAKSEGGTITKKLAKGFSVGLWGLTRQVVEQRHRVGEMFNPVWAAQIKSVPRLIVAECLYSHKVRSPVHIITDGFGCEYEIPLTDAEKALGWELDYKGDLLVASTGLFWYSTKHPGSMTIGDVRKMISEAPEAPYYQKTKRKMVTLGDALKFNDLSALGTKRDYRVSLDFNDMKHNRDFTKVPRTGQELITKHFTSIPYEVGENT